MKLIIKPWYLYSIVLGEDASEKGRCHYCWPEDETEVETCQRSRGMELISYNHISSPELDTYALLIGNGDQLVLVETDSLDLLYTPPLR